MTRALPAAYAAPDQPVPLVLIAAHVGGQTHRYIADITAREIGGETHQPLNFHWTPPRESDGNPTSAITIGMHDSQLSRAAPMLDADWSGAELDISLWSPAEGILWTTAMTVERVTLTARGMQLQLTYDRLLDIPAVRVTFSPAQFPGLYK